MPGLSQLSKYWHTVRHLRPVQVTSRVRHVLLKPPRIDAAAHASPHLRSRSGNFVAVSARAPTMTGPASFQFLNQPGQLDAATSWNNTAQTKLWLYNLHYFDDLNAVSAHQRAAWHRDLIQRWLKENPPHHGNGWEPYPLSLRIVNWIKWALAGNTLTPQATASLSLQSASLAGQIEWHLLGNHLAANAKALIFAGCFFDGAAAQHWLQQGLRIYERELSEQILPDGGHFERSPMYHAIILDDLLDVINLSRSYPGLIPRAIIATLEDICPRMLRWLSIMCHPDGDISFFNDAAFGIAPSPSALLDYAHRLGLAPSTHEAVGITHLEPSGYLRCARSRAVLICDCAHIGPDYLPGHAHADTLSFEFSLAGSRLIVNGGTSTYGTGADRLRERGTAAHSTVVVDDADSSEVWSGFRVARRARILGRTASANEDAFEITASHDGYRRLPGGNIHTRTWRLSDTELIITDRVTGAYRSAVARFHLGHGISATMYPTGKQGSLRTPSGEAVNWVAHCACNLVPSSWHPEFGKAISTQCIDVPVLQGVAQMVLRWSHT